MRRVVLFAIAGSALVFTGCILFGIDDLSGGADGGSNDDASNSRDVISSDDDASSSGDDASIDSAIADGGNEGGPFCPQIGAVLCSDFDDVDIDAAIPGPWDSVFAPSPAFIVTNTAMFKSAPRSVKMSTVSAAVVASLTKTVTTSHVQLSFDMFMEAIGATPSIAAFTVSGAGGVSFRPSGIEEADTLSDGGTSRMTTSGVGIPTGTWVHIDCVMDLTTHVATLSQNGIQTMSRSISSTAAWTGKKSMGVGLGFGDSNNTTIDYDNVTITIQ